MKVEKINEFPEVAPEDFPLIETTKCKEILDGMEIGDIIHITFTDDGMGRLWLILKMFIYQTGFNGNICDEECNGKLFKMTKRDCELFIRRDS